MRALCWHGKNDVRVDTVPDPKIQEPTDVIIKITSTAICGSDLHLYDGFMMGMEKGDVLGHEPMGIVVEVGSSVRKLKKGDRVVVPFVIACGHCFFCTKQLYSCCDTTNPDAEKASKLMGAATAGHGRAVQGPEMRSALHLLAENFDHYGAERWSRRESAGDRLRCSSACSTR